MIPGIALMIAVYGSARVLNDGLKRHPGDSAATGFTWLISAIAILILWALALMINVQGSSTTSTPLG